FFHYTVRISNEGDETVQLLTRHWIITDATGATEEVRGEGVVGEQPVLRPGESFQYTSGCPLKTSTGVMRGAYQMVTEDGDHFDVEIAPFALHDPYTAHTSSINLGHHSYVVSAFRRTVITVRLKPDTTYVSRS